MRVAIIPARGGSKRIPRKNIREFLGKPMIAHSIECAFKCGLFERVIVSTDDTEIAHVARAFAAEVPFVRPVELADDFVGTTQVVAHAVDWLQARRQAPTAVCCIYATAPFMDAADLKRGFELLDTGRWQFVFAATTFPASIFRSFGRSAQGGLEMFFPGHYSRRSQDLPEALHDAGQFYWGLPDAWSSDAVVFGPRSEVVIVPRWRVQDIDTPEDWTRAEAMGGYLGSAAASLA